MDKTTQPGKLYILMYFTEAGGWRNLPYDTVSSDDPADFDTVEEGRELARTAAATNSFRTRVVNRVTRKVEAEYRKDGVVVK